MKKRKRSLKDKKIQVLLDEMQLAKVRRLANEIFDGNISLTVRYIINKHK